MHLAAALQKLEAVEETAHVNEAGMGMGMGKQALKDEEKMGLQKVQLMQENIAEEPERKCEEVAHVLITEGDLASSQEGGELAATQCQEMDEQIRLMDWNLTCLSAAAEKHFQKEDKYEEEGKILTHKEESAQIRVPEPAPQEERSEIHSSERQLLEVLGAFAHVS
ncbi:Tropomyosin alpha-3 chain [Fukomys damarensis]|uniref:Tropomyosin alpha-3 chain n=1 Tax=Fukomys damarensis TaxID=885580 RepID=A0A091CNB0_FUKDA|nr:Tropomyosin alpha-3 chain [Fukomys damarensis]